MKSATALMGKIVIVDKLYQRNFEIWGNNQLGTRKFWVKVNGDERAGWVVGERWLQDGVSANDFDYGNQWTPDGVVHHCLLVAYWPSMKAVRVPMDGYRIAPETEKPYSPGAETSWPPSAREYASKEMQEWPRDKKGRWVKK